MLESLYPVVIKFGLIVQNTKFGSLVFRSHVPALKEDPSFADALSAADAVVIPKTKYGAMAKASSSRPMTFLKELHQRKSKMRPKTEQVSSNSLQSKINFHSLYLAAPPDNCLSIKKYPFAASKKRHELQRFGYCPKYIQKKN